MIDADSDMLLVVLVHILSQMFFPGGDGRSNGPLPQYIYSMSSVFVLFIYSPDVQSLLHLRDNDGLTCSGLGSYCTLSTPAPPPDWLAAVEPCLHGSLFCPR